MILFTGTTQKVQMKLFSLILLGRKYHNECHYITIAVCVCNSPYLCSFRQGVMEDIPMLR